jgi:pre-rRNA-processing protein TSR4
MDPNAEKLSGLRITSLDDEEEDDEPELPHQHGPAAAVAYEDYDDDEDEEAEVMLGLLEEPKRPGLLLRHLFPSKAGGTPVRTTVLDRNEKHTR